MANIASTAPNTTAQALDSISDQVLDLARATPRRTHADLAGILFRQHGLKVSPDNLRVWLNRHFAEQFRIDVVPAVHNSLDDYIELVNNLRPAYTWVQILACIKGIDTTAKHTPEGLRVWYSRRMKRGQKMLATKEVTEVGAAALRAARVQPSDVFSSPISRASLDHSSVVRVPESAAAVPPPVAVTRTSGTAADVKARAAADLANMKHADPVGDALRFAGVPKSNK